MLFFGCGEQSSPVAGFLVNNGTGDREPLPGAAMNAAFAAGITSPGGDMGSLDDKLPAAEKKTHLDTVDVWNTCIYLIYIYI